MEIKKYEYIDSLRGIAILMVIIVHIQSYFKLPTTIYFPDILDRVIYNMRIGVSLFFIVSAFTLTISHARRKTEKNATLKFFIRRFFRIAPTYYLAILIIFGSICIQIPEYFQVTRSFWFYSNFLFLNTLSPKIIGTIVPGGWSISVEFLFYILFPLFLSKIKNANDCIIFFTISTVVAALFHYNFQTDLSFAKFEFMKLNFLYQLPVFFLGILAYFLIKDGLNSVKQSSMFLLIALLVLFNIIPMPYYMLWSIAFMTLILVLHSKNYKILSNKILAKIGEVSFSMYIIHFFVINIFNKFYIGALIPISGFYTSLLNFILLYIIVTLISFALANITYKVIEIPGQNLGRKLIKKIDQHNKISV